MVDVFVIPLLKILIVLNATLVAVTYMVLLERKVIAWTQSRLGPMRVGPYGILQPVADAVKLMIKEDITPTRADKWVFTAAPIISMVPALVVYAVIPFGSEVSLFGRQVTLYVTDINVGLLYVVGVASVGVYGIILAGYASNSKFPLLASLRASAQLISYEVSVTLTLVSVVLLAVAVGGLMGLVNGLLVAYGRVPAIITTLGTLAIYRTFLVSYSNAQTVITASLPEWLLELPRLNLFSLGAFDVRLVVGIALGFVLLFQLLITYLPYGRRLYAIGSNPDAARLAGLPVQRTLMSAFVLCGALSGLAGFLFLARFGNITVVAAQGLELQVVAAVVVGGVNIFGGSGTMLGALLGTVLIATLEQSLLRWAQIGEFWRDALLGLLILLAVASDAVIINRLRTLWARDSIQRRGDVKRET